jgi:hypothetical protein
LNNKLVLFALVLGVALVAFPSGFLLGRQFPAHHYQVLSTESPSLLLDNATGRVCDIRPPQVKGASNSADSAALEVMGAKPVTPSGFPYCGKSN